MVLSLYEKETKQEMKTRYHGTRGPRHATPRNTVRERKREHILDDYEVYHIRAVTHHEICEYVYLH